MSETGDEALVEAAGEPGKNTPHFLALSLYRFAYRSGRRRARLHGRSPFAESNGNTTPCYREEYHRRFEGNGDETPGPDKGLLRKAPELLDTAFDAHGPDGLLGDSYRRIYFILFFFPPAHNLRPFWLFPLMQILQPRPDPAYVLSHSGARRADRTCNSYPFEGITFEGLASNTNVETTNFEKRICC